MPTKRETGTALEFLGVSTGKLDICECKHLGKAPAPRRHPEAAEQAEVIRWAQRSEAQYPELRLLFHIPNGGSRKSAVEGAALKRQGVRAGVPDLFLPVPSGSYHGLFLELKQAQTGRLQPAQREWLNRLSGQGYRAVVCHGAEAAKAEILTYLERKKG